MCRLIEGKEGTFSIVPNEYPYDLITTKHDILIFKKHGKNLSFNDMYDLYLILNKQTQYDAVLWNYPHSQSVGGHFHIHLLKYKEYADVLAGM